MAIDTWMNGTADKNAANKQDRTDHRHAIVRGTAAAGDFTLAFDSAVVTKLATFDSLVTQTRAQIVARSILTT